MTKKALISKLEIRETGYRVAQVVNTNEIFPVGEPDHFWVDCPDNIITDKYWYNPNDYSFVALPEPIPDNVPKKPTFSSI